jgi:hypothetical protein
MNALGRMAALALGLLGAPVSGQEKVRRGE